MSNSTYRSDIVPAVMEAATNRSNAQSALVVPLTRNQIRGFWASWGGWALDGMDSFIYALVLVPSLRELLPRSGIAATKGSIGFYGGLLFALFLFGWGLAFLWGPAGDRFGRIRTLMVTIVWYSAFTFLSAVVTNIWQLAILRLLAGIGIGGEWAMGGTFVAEEWPESRRRTGACYMLASVCGLWAGTVYVPAAVTALAEAAGKLGPAAAQLASRAVMLVSFATILGCLAMPWLAEKFGRRGALGFYFSLMLAFIALTFGKVFYLGAAGLPWFFACLFFLGFGGANFAVYA